MDKFIIPGKKHGINARKRLVYRDGNNHCGGLVGRKLSVPVEVGI